LFGTNKKTELQHYSQLLCYLRDKLFFHKVKLLFIWNVLEYHIEAIKSTHGLFLFSCLSIFEEKSRSIDLRPGGAILVI